MTALGSAYLVAGNTEAAVRFLEVAAAAAGAGNALSDLAAAYLAHRAATGKVIYGVAALESALHAAVLTPDASAPRFNLALALERLDLVDEAINAWADYLHFESDAGWKAEAQRRLRHLRSLRALPAQSIDNQRIRESIEDTLLPAWGAGILVGKSWLAMEALRAAERSAELLVQSKGDRLPLEAVRAIRRSLASPSTIKTLATGHVLFGESRAAYLADAQRTAAEKMTEAARWFGRVGSPYAYWAPVYRSIHNRNLGNREPALREALDVVGRRELLGTSLMARALWASAVANTASGRYDRARDLVALSNDVYTTIGERDNRIATQTILAEAEWFLGNADAAWSQIVATLAEARAGGGTRRDYHYLLGSLMATGSRLHRAALVFDDARIAAAKSDRSRAEAHLSRARTRAAIGDIAGASTDVAAAVQSAERLTDTALKARSEADARIAVARIARSTDCGAAVVAADEALPYVSANDPATRLGDLLMLRAACAEKLGRNAEARSGYEAAIAAFEGKRRNLRSLFEKAQAFESERQAYEALVALELATGGNDRALEIVDQARSAFDVSAPLERGQSVVPISERRKLLPAHTALVYFEVLSDKTAAWFVTRGDIQYFEARIGVNELTRAVREINEAVAAGATLSDLVEMSAAIWSGLLQPTIARAREVSRLVFVLDEPLHSIPLGAIPDSHGVPLLVRFTLSIAPGIDRYLDAMRRSTAMRSDSVLAVGDGHDPVATGLPLLPLANDEARRIGDLYPQRDVLAARAATITNIERLSADVFHFAGHSVASGQYPAMSRLLLASDPAGRGDAWLAQQIIERTFSRTFVAVLSSCEGASGRFVAGEGAMSLARSFFEAGVPAVVASVWPVQDDVVDLMTDFHRGLKSTHDPAMALRLAQLRSMNVNGVPEAVRRWGGFVTLGG